MTNGRRVPLLLMAAACLVSPAAADTPASQLIRLSMRTPIDVTIKSRFTFHSETSETDWDQAIEIVFRRDGETVYASERAATGQVTASAAAGQVTMRVDCLYRHGELLRFQRVLEGETVKQQMAVFVSPKVGPSASKPAVGDVFTLNPHCPIVGCVDGFFLDEYFPDAGRVSAEAANGEVHVRSQTNLGTAEAWLDPSRDNVPKRISIKKDSEHVTTSMRRVGDVLYDMKDPRSALKELWFEVADITVDKDTQGRPFLRRCSLRSKKVSDRGLEEEESTGWEVESIDLDPAFREGRIYPDVAISDGEAVTAEGAAHLPYMWSEKARWVVPAFSLSADADLGEPAPRRKWRLYLIAGANIGLLAAAVVFWYVTRRRARA